MAARSPTSYALDYTETQTHRGKYIYDTLPDKVLDNQWLLADEPRLVLRQVQSRTIIVSGTTKVDTPGTVRFRRRNAAGTDTFQIWALCWSDAAGTASDGFTVTVDIDSGTATPTKNFSVGGTSKVWNEITASTTFDTTTDEHEIVYGIEMNFVSSTKAFLAGIAVLHL